MKSHIVIPARLQSTRLARKMLLRETGMPLVEHTYRQASLASKPLGVSVACDDQQIVDVVEAFGGTAILTSPDCASGTDRVAEVARTMPDADIIVNVQGDEPEMSPDAIDMVIELLEDHPDCVMSSAAAPIRDRSLLDDPSKVKVVRDQSGRAMYFSRSMIPHPRNWHDELLTCDPPLFLVHLGLYAYRRDFLLAMAQLPPSPLETTEMLEQLRVLHHGFGIQIGLVDCPTFGIDTREDYEQFVARHRAGSQPA